VSLNYGALVFNSNVFFFFQCTFVIKHLYSNDSSGTSPMAAVALRESFAANVSIQWQQPSLPLHKMVNSAVSPLPPASHFGGYMAEMAIGLHCEQTFKLL